MLKKISIDQLAVGMKLMALDRPWYATPFVRHRFKISSRQELETLRQCGVKTVEVEIADDEEAAVAQAPQVAEEQIVLEEPLPSIAELAVRLPQGSEAATVPFGEEMGMAKEVYQQAKAIVQEVFDDLRSGREIKTEAVATLVDSLTDSIFRNQDVLTSLSRLKSYDDYTFAHSVNTCVLAIAVGRHLQLGRDKIKLLGMGTLLHDVGKVKIPAEVLNKPGKLATQEMMIVREHALRGADLLSKMTGLEAVAALPALEHHERPDGRGYPFQKVKRELSEFGLIAGVVDCYDAMTTHRVYRKALPQSVALNRLYTMGRAGQLDLSLVEGFICCVGIYPVGSCVQLNTGEIAIVARANREQALNPSVLVVRAGISSPTMTPRFLDLSTQSARPIKRIKSVLDPAPLGLAPNELLEHAAAA